MYICRAGLLPNRVTVEVGEDTAANFTVGGTVRSRRLQAVEDPQVVIDVLEAGLLTWANEWAANVIPGDKVSIDASSTA